MEELLLVRAVTKKGQVTIPAEIRRILGIETDSHVVFKLRDGQVTLSAAKETLASAYGAVEPLSRPEDWRLLREQAIEDKAEATVSEMKADDDLS